MINTDQDRVVEYDSFNIRTAERLMDDAGDSLKDPLAKACLTLAVVYNAHLISSPMTVRVSRKPLTYGNSLICLTQRLKQI